MTQLSKYTLHEPPLGRGGYGTVYRAFDNDLKVERAVKVLHPQLAADPEFIARFRQEAQIAARLEHPHIIPVYDLGEDQGRFYLAMKYLPGGSLKEMLEQDGPLSFARALEILTQIASALDFAYEREKLIHRDIKPGNLLFEEHGVARLADFGFAKALAASESASFSVSGGILGTPAYMAPETWENQPPSPAGDVYSLACVFYEMITGVALFEGQSPLEIMRTHALEEPQLLNEWPEGVPVNTSVVLHKALAKLPQDRHPLAGEFAASIEALKTEERAQQDATEKERQTVIMPAAREAEERIRQEMGQVAQATASKQPELISKPSTMAHNETIISQSPEAQKTSVWIWIALAIAGTIVLGWGGWYISSRQIRHPNNKPAAVIASEMLSQTAALQTDTPITTSTESSLRQPTSTPTALPSPTEKTSLSLEPTGQSLVLMGTRVPVSNVVINPENVAEITQLAQLEGVSRLTRLSPNGNILATWSGSSIRLYRVSDGILLHTLEGHTNAISNVVFSPDSSILASGTQDTDTAKGAKDKDTTIRLWNVSDGTLLNIIEGPSEPVSGLAFSPDGKTLASSEFGCCYDVKRLVRLWDVSDGTQINTFGSGHEPIFSPNGEILATASNDLIRLWQIDGTLLQTLRGHTEYITSLDFSSDGKFLASGGMGDDDRVRVWRISDGSLLYSLEGHASWDVQVKFSPDGRLLATTGTDDCSVRIWQISNGALLTAFPGRCLRLTFSLDGSLLINGGIYLGIPSEQ